MSSYNYSVPAVINGTVPEMLNPGYWLNNLTGIDRELLSPIEIENFNQTLLDKGLINPLEEALHHKESFNLLITKAEQTLNDYYELLKQKKLFNPKGDLFTLNQLDVYYATINLLEHKTFALINKFSNERLLPESSVLTEEPFDYEFDFLQNNGLDISCLCLLIAKTNDNKWLFQINKSSMGWVKAENLNIIEHPEYLSKLVKMYIYNKSVPVFSDYQCQHYYCSLRMGNTILIKKDYNDEIYELFLSDKQDTPKCFIKQPDAHIKPLSYSLRNIYEQAFSFLHTPYGWGDINQFIDCSKFLQLTFASFGFKLPRNGIAQGQSGKCLLDNISNLDLREKEDLIIKDGLPGRSFIRFPGHIMLYLGSVNNKAYVLHCLYKYREKIDNEIINRIVNRVCVTDLTLGKDSDRKSFIERISQINLL